MNDYNAQIEQMRIGGNVNYALLTKLLREKIETGDITRRDVGIAELIAKLLGTAKHRAIFVQARNIYEFSQMRQQQK